MTTFKITSATTDGTTLSVSAKGDIQIGIRNDEKGKSISIIASRSLNISILEGDLPETEKEQLSYIKSKVEEAYDALPDLTLAKQIIGKEWIPVIKKL